MRTLQEILAEVDPAVRDHRYDDLAALVAEARELKTPKAEAVATGLESRIHALRGDPTQALTLLERALAIEETIDGGRADWGQIGLRLRSWTANPTILRRSVEDCVVFVDES